MVELKVLMQEFIQGRTGCIQPQHLLESASHTPPTSTENHVILKAQYMRQFSIAKNQSVWSFFPISFCLFDNCSIRKSSSSADILSCFVFQENEWTRIHFKSTWREEIGGHKKITWPVVICPFSFLFWHWQCTICTVRMLKAVKMYLAIEFWPSWGKKCRGSQLKRKSLLYFCKVLNLWNDKEFLFVSRIHLLLLA